MAELRTVLTKAGLLDVQTYIQSGNVVAKSQLDQDSIQALVHDAIAQEIGADIVVFARTHRQIKRVLAGNPYPLHATARTYFSLLAAAPPSPIIEKLRQVDFSPDRVELAGGVIYTLYATKHSDSKFNNNFFERKLKIAATTRNFNTMSRLVEFSA